VLESLRHLLHSIYDVEGLVRAATSACLHSCFVETDSLSDFSFLAIPAGNRRRVCRSGHDSAALAFAAGDAVRDRG